ncbi:MAG: Dabb family protein [Lentimicrobiaceae bacterium]|nr:Dabb family protein [Lentimicrobiaceae bacterium]MBT3453696.1 Dabb family protein [Lentimicrobiaceae bacterium]MBT3818219.1 Dabb family protein [Lentimicrobiaceae bacterium]MBT4061765.1 Dabb family protein [Lentimicrobiaceae bacterium]MBT4190943.1 Dabb family protein [Lentimicrobiaceae bacterium]
MIRHIVMIKLKEDKNTPEIANQLKNALLELENTIESLDRMDVGINISTRPSAFNIVLTADFANDEALENYRVHPEHVKVLDYLKLVIAKAHVVDYII